MAEWEISDESEPRYGNGTSSTEAWARRIVEPLGVRWPGLPPKLRSAVVGVDGSFEGYHAVRWAALLADEIHLVCAADSFRTPSDPLTGLPSDHAMSRLRAGAAAVLREARPLLEGRRFTERVEEASAQRAIAGRADEVGAGLILVGHSSKGAVGRVVLGATAEALAHRSPRPVLVCRGLPGAGPIVAGIGTDESSAYAAGWAIAVASWLRQQPILAHAAHGSHILQDSPELMAVSWPPRKGLAQLASAMEASMVVVGHGTRPGWLGSQAMALVRHAPCSVLVARPWKVRERAPAA